MRQDETVKIVSPEKIPGAPSFDAQFGVGANNVGRSPFNVSAVEADKQQKILNRRK